MRNDFPDWLKGRIFTGLFFGLILGLIYFVAWLFGAKVFH